MVVYHETLSGTVTPRTLGPYEFIATPPQQLVLNAILDQCGVGECISPGVRGLAEQAGVSRGLITDCLRTLAQDGWIDYDGRSIILLRDPSSDESSDRSGDRSACDEAENEPEEVIDQVIDHYIAADLSDRSGDRSPEHSPLLAAVKRIATRWNEDRPLSGESDRSGDRSPHMVHDQVTTTGLVVVHESSTTGGSGGKADRSGDRSHSAAQVMAEPYRDNPIALLLAELLPPPGRSVLERVLAARNWTPQQIRDRYEFDQARIDASGGKLHIGIFWTALMAGELAPPRADPERPLDPAAYADRDGFKLGSDMSDQDDSLYARANRLLPPVTPETIRTAGADLAFVLEQLGMGKSDDQVRAALVVRAQRRGTP
jgi:hypothetical protein